MENNAHILISKDEGFLNPIQEFYRDMSLACMRVAHAFISDLIDARAVENGM
ncbi:hypothetical protein OG21DRAFT_1507287 [Imleria badia]|nr:hypothetical protein OG21DRAFT_1507287 [Imleria badia]